MLQASVYVLEKKNLKHMFLKIIFFIILVKAIQIQQLALLGRTITIHH